MTRLSFTKYLCNLLLQFVVTHSGMQSSLYMVYIQQPHMFHLPSDSMHIGMKAECVMQLGFMKQTVLNACHWHYNKRMLPCISAASGLAYMSGC